MKKIKCFCLCEGQRSKKHFLLLSTFALDLDETWPWLIWKFKKTWGTSGFKGQKFIFFFHLLSHRILRKLGHGWYESLKKTSGTSGFKGQKKHYRDFCTFLFNVKGFGCEISSIVEKTLFRSHWKVSITLYTSGYAMEKIWTNWIQEPWKPNNQIDSH